MEKFRVLNLYACLGGNRYKWDEVSDNLEIVAVELDPYLADAYSERFPNDEVVIGDAAVVLLERYEDFDFVWSSPPCPTHSKMRKVNTGKGERKSPATFPDMRLYQEIIFLEHFFKGKYCVENVISYYNPLIAPIKRGRHYYWTNFNLPNNLNSRDTKDFIKEGKGYIDKLLKFHEIDRDFYHSFKRSNGDLDKDQVLRNMVDYMEGKTILETVFGIYNSNNTAQISIFDE
jgi:DNA (cytosine-5)-methyltransferase 1